MFSNSSNPKNIFEEIKPLTPQNQKPIYTGTPELPSPLLGDDLDEKPKKSKRLLIFGAIFIFLALIIGGGVFAYFRGYISLPFLSPKIDEVLAKTFETFKELKTARYTAELQIIAQEREEGVEPLNLDFLKNSNTNANSNSNFGDSLELESENLLYSFIPTDLDLQLQFSGIYNKKTSKDERPKNESSLSGHYKSAGTTMEVDMSLKTIEGNYYLLFEKFPSLFFVDFTPYSGKWIEVTKDTSGTPFDSLLLFKNNLKTDQSAKIQEQVHQIITLALKHKVIAIKNPNKSETIDGHKTYVVNLVVSRENLKAYYKELTDTLSKDYGDKAIIKYNEKTAAKFDQAEFQHFFDYWQKNSTITFWIDSRLGIPRKMSFQFKFAPPEEVTKFKDKQLNIAINFTLKDINEPIKIEKPDGAVSWDELDREARGITVGEQKIEKQNDRITHLKSALRYYRQLFDEYPATWEELRASADKEITDERDKNYQKLLQSSLDSANMTDIFTGKEYPYQKKDNGFEITYQISFEDVNDENKEKTPYNYFIEGTNTTNEGYDISLEKETEAESVFRDPFEELKKQDTDSDGLNDYLETYTYKTSPNKKDTDGDGYEDKTEVDSGYNPNGSGKLEDVSDVIWN
ncbi:MAG: hypothetical protein ACD_12C00869G0004 [uncultured bacterium]|nr:MAG: hypothetical protein ACD_12C00869G0004 [uncultured bacterium]